MKIGSRKISTQNFSLDEAQFSNFTKFEERKEKKRGLSSPNISFSANLLSTQNKTKKKLPSREPPYF